MERESKSTGKGGKGKGSGDGAIKCAAGCGKPGTQRCNGCKAVFYCGVECQRIHWKKNGHKVACKKTQARVAAAMASAAGGAPTHTNRSPADGAPVCIICLDAGDPPPIQSGCGCRGDAGLAHVGCRAEAAAYKARSGDTDGWHWCHTCSQMWTGQMGVGMAEAWCASVQGFDKADERWQAAGLGLVEVLGQMGRRAECEAKCRELRAVQQRMSGPDSDIAMRTAHRLGDVLCDQNKMADAEVVYREVHPKLREQLGADHPDTLGVRMSLGNVFLKQGKLDAAVATYQDVRAIQRRVLGDEDVATMTTTLNLASVFGRQSKFPESEALLRELLGVQTRKLGADHPATVTTGRFLCTALYSQQKYGEAEARCREVQAAHRRLFGVRHPETPVIAQLLATISQHT
jgi:hypothetical protein